MRVNLYRPLALVIALIAMLAIPMAAGAQENPPPSVPSLEGQCGVFYLIAGQYVCLVPTGGFTEIDVESGTVTFTHTGWGLEGSLSVVIRNQVDGANAVHAMDTSDVIFYSDLYSAFHADYWVDPQTGMTVAIPDAGTTVFYLGFYGLPGEQMRLTFGELDPTKPTVDSAPYAWQFFDYRLYSW